MATFGSKDILAFLIYLHDVTTCDVINFSNNIGISLQPDKKALQICFTCFSLHRHFTKMLAGAF